MTKWTLRCMVLSGWLLAGAALHAHHSLLLACTHWERKRR